MYIAPPVYCTSRLLIKFGWNLFDSVYISHPNHYQIPLGFFFSLNVKESKVNHTADLTVISEMSRLFTSCRIKDFVVSYNNCEYPSNDANTCLITRSPLIGLSTENKPHFTTTFLHTHMFAPKKVAFQQPIWKVPPICLRITAGAMTRHG